MSTRGQQRQRNEEQLQQAAVRENRGCPAVSQTCRGFWEAPKPSMHLSGGQRPEKCLLRTLSRQGDALLLPFRHCAFQGQGGQLGKYPGCEGDRKLSKKLHKMNLWNGFRIQSSNSDQAILLPFKWAPAAPNLVMLLDLQWLSLWF